MRGPQTAQTDCIQWLQLIHGSGYILCQHHTIELRPERPTVHAHDYTLYTLHTTILWRGWPAKSVGEAGVDALSAAPAAPAVHKHTRARAKSHVRAERVGQRCDESMHVRARTSAGVAERRGAARVRTGRVGHWRVFGERRRLGLGGGTRSSCSSFTSRPLAPSVAGRWSPRSDFLSCRGSASQSNRYVPYLPHRDAIRPSMSASARAM